MDAAEMARRIQAQRQSWHELDDPPRRALLIRRPPETALLRYRAGMTNEQVEELTIESTVGWRGFTDADLLGAAIGGSDEHLFDKDVFALWIRDNAKILSGAAAALMQQVMAHGKKTEDAGKN